MAPGCFITRWTSKARLFMPGIAASGTTCSCGGFRVAPTTTPTATRSSRSPTLTISATRRQSGTWRRPGSSSGRVGFPATVTSCCRSAKPGPSWTRAVRLAVPSARSATTRCGEIPSGRFPPRTCSLCARGFAPVPAAVLSHAGAKRLRQRWVSFHTRLFCRQRHAGGLRYPPGW